MVMVVDGNYHNKLRVEQIPGIIETYAAQNVSLGSDPNDTSEGVTAHD